MQKIITNSYNQAIIKKSLLAKQQCLAVDVVSIEQFLNSYSVDQNDNSLYEYYALLSKNNWQYFNASINDANFLEEVRSFVIQMKQFQINPSDLPQEDSYLKELSQIIECVYDVALPIDQQLKFLNDLDDCRDVIIVDPNPNIFSHKVYDYLISKGARRYNLNNELKDVTYNNFLNKRSEIEFLARYLVDHPQYDVEDIKITILDSSYKAFIKQIFKRYAIPYTILSDKQTSALANKYITLLKYYLQPSRDNLLKVIDADVFQQLDTKKLQNFKTYIQLFEKDLDDNFTHLTQTQISNDIVSEYELSSLTELENDALQIQEIIKADIDELLTVNDLSQVISKVDALVIKNNNLNDQEVELNKIRQVLKKSLALINKNNINILLFELAKIKQTYKSDQGIIIADANEMVLNKPYHFVLGASSNNFPSFSAQQGIFNERYIQKISKYPSLVQRYDLFMQNQLANLQSPFLYVSYSVASLEGKEQKSSLEIDELLKQEAQYQEVKFTNKKYEHPNVQLSSDLAQQLFFNNYEFKGSVSTLEKYQNCPFSYFLDKGLGLKPQNDYHYNSLKNGLLIHYVLEQLAEQKMLDANANVEQVMEILKPKIDELKQVYPNMSDELDLIQINLITNIMMNLQYLNKLNQKSMLKNSKQEKYVSSTWEIEGVKLKMRGFVDRIKYNDDFIQIIDYKSSARSLEAKKVLAGQQLQLLTYALLLQQENPNKRIIGAYYYNCQIGSITATYGKRQRGEVVVNDEQTYFNELAKEHLYNGWTFEPYYEVIGGDQGCLKGIQLKKDGSLKATSHIYDLAKIEEVIFQIYQYILKDIKNGKIDIKPIDCKYCTYQSICHYQGKGNDKEAIIDMEKEELYRKDLNV